MELREKKNNNKERKKKKYIYIKKNDGDFLVIWQVCMTIIADCYDFLLLFSELRYRQKKKNVKHF